MNKSHFEKLENMYLQANVNTMIFDTTTAKISEGKSTIGLTTSDGTNDQIVRLSYFCHFKNNSPTMTKTVTMRKEMRNFFTLK